jgi:hypothetical protein
MVCACSAGYCHYDEIRGKCPLAKRSNDRSGSLRVLRPAIDLWGSCRSCWPPIAGSLERACDRSRQRSPTSRQQRGGIIKGAQQGTKVRRLDVADQPQHIGAQGGHLGARVARVTREVHVSAG